jgi:hypothetical protein
MRYITLMAVHLWRPACVHFAAPSDTKRRTLQHPKVSDFLKPPFEHLATSPTQILMWIDGTRRSPSMGPSVFTRPGRGLVVGNRNIATDRVLRVVGAWSANKPNVPLGRARRIVVDRSARCSHHFQLAKIVTAAGREARANFTRCSNVAARLRCSPC